MVRDFDRHVVFEEVRGFDCHDVFEEVRDFGYCVVCEEISFLVKDFDVFEEVRGFCSRDVCEEVRDLGSRDVCEEAKDFYCHDVCGEVKDFGCRVVYEEENYFQHVLGSDPADVLFRDLSPSAVLRDLFSSPFFRAVDFLSPLALLLQRLSILVEFFSPLLLGVSVLVFWDQRQLLDYSLC